MNVANFFKFIASKKPNEYSINQAFGYMTDGYNIPADENSSIDPDKFIMNGLFTTKEPTEYEFPNTLGYKKYNENELEDFYFVFDMSNSQSASLLADLYGYKDMESLISTLKHKAGIEEPILRKEALNPNYMYDITDIVFKSDEDGVMTFCQNYLKDLDENDYEVINFLMNKHGYDDDDFKYDLENSNSYEFLNYLNELIDELDLPYKVYNLHNYLFQCFQSVAEYVINRHNSKKPHECGNINGDCNINHLSFKWPLVYVHLNITYKDIHQPVYGSVYDKVIDVKWLLQSGKLSDYYIEQYFEKYPIE
jgi:hypothetical protein